MRDPSEVTIGELESILATRKGVPTQLKSIIDKMKRGDKLNDSDKELVLTLITPGNITNTLPEDFEDLVISTTPNIEGSKIIEYLGIVSGETIMGGNLFRDMIAGVSDAIGGRSGVYESKFREAKETAIYEMEEQAIANGANAIVGVKMDYEMVRNAMMMVSIHGTAVKIVQEKTKRNLEKK